MAMQLLEDFSSFGTGSASRAAMLASPYWTQTFGSNVACSQTNPRITGGWSLQWGGGNQTASAAAIYSTPRATVFYAGAYRWSGGYAAVLYKFFSSDIAPTTCCSVGLTSAGAVYVKNADGTLLATSANGVVTAGSYYDFETKVFAHSTTGTIEVRVNGIVIHALTGRKTLNTGSVTAKVGYVDVVEAEWVTGASINVDTVRLFDDTGAYCNDFMGVKIAVPVALAADDGGNQWAITGAGSGVDALNDAAPNPASYIQAAAANYVSKFSFGAAPSWLTNIKCLTLRSRQVTSSSGVATTTVKLESGASTDDGNVGRTVPYPTATLYQDHFYVDPDTSSAFVWSDIGSMYFKVKRES